MEYNYSCISFAFFSTGLVAEPETRVAYGWDHLSTPEHPRWTHGLTQSKDLLFVPLQGRLNSCVYSGHCWEYWVAQWRPADVINQSLALHLLPLLLKKAIIQSNESINPNLNCVFLLTIIHTCLAIFSANANGIDDWLRGCLGGFITVNGSLVLPGAAYLLNMYQFQL